MHIRLRVSSEEVKKLKTHTRQRAWSEEVKKLKNAYKADGLI